MQLVRFEAEHLPAPGQFWVSYVHWANRVAHAFLICNQWRCARPDPDAEGMLRFEYGLDT